MELISIVVPVYNVEKYIHRCISSIMNQTYKNIEMVLVDDGSSDKSPQICDSFARNDSRIKVVHKENGGVGAARNRGMNIAKGEYLCFVDGDDFLPLTAIENLYKGIKESNADMCCGCWAKISVKYTTCNGHLERTVLSENKDDLMEIMDYEEIKGPVAKLYKTNLIKSKGLFFPEDIKISEDTIFVYQYLQECDSIHIINKNVYYYNRLSVGSATTQYYDKFNLSSFLCIVEYAKNIIKTNENWHDLKLQQKIVNQYILTNQYIMFYKNADREEALSKLKETYLLFKDYIKVKTINENNQLFQAFIDIHEYLQNNDFEGLFDFLNEDGTKKNTRNIITLKNCLIDLLVKVKIFILFKLKIGYMK